MGPRTLGAVTRAALALVVVAGWCAGGRAVEVTNPPTKIEHLKYRLVGALSGSVSGEAAKQAIGPADAVYYPTVADMFAALDEGAVAGVAHDRAILAAVAAGGDSYRVLAEKVLDGEYALATRLDDAALGDAVATAFAALREDGELEKLKAKWLDGSDREKGAPPAPGGSGDEKLRLGVALVGEPFVYRDSDGGLAGFDIELAHMLARKLERTLEIEEVLSADLFAALKEGKVDAIGSALMVTADREKDVRFSPPYAQGGVAVLVRTYW